MCVCACPRVRVCACVYVNMHMKIYMHTTIIFTSMSAFCNQARLTRVCVYMHVQAYTCHAHMHTLEPSIPLKPAQLRSLRTFMTASAGTPSESRTAASSRPSRRWSAGPARRRRPAGELGIDHQGNETGHKSVGARVHGPRVAPSSLSQDEGTRIFLTVAVRAQRPG